MPRPKGSLNKRTIEVTQRLEQLQCDPIEGMVIIAQQAMSAGDLALAGSMFKELAQYIAPKRKAVDVSSSSADGGALTINFVPDGSDDD